MSNQDNIIRLSKNKIAQSYYQFRIDTEPSPYKIKFRKNSYKVIWILSHMRSGSSLLTHILVSNPAITGYGETHTNYDNQDDLKKLIFKIYWKTRNYRMDHDYVLDKILHNHKITNHNILKSSEIYTIFLLREPARTLASILEIKPDWSQTKAYDYYINRLLKLEEYRHIIGSKNRVLYLNYEQIIQDSNSVFKALKKFLGTKHSFSEEYQILRTTGVKGIGDSSDNIKAGRIIRNQKTADNCFDSHLIEQANRYYERCQNTLMSDNSTINNYL